jgi:hypothetical protein
VPFLVAATKQSSIPFALSQVKVKLSFIMVPGIPESAPMHPSVTFKDELESGDDEDEDDSVVVSPSEMDETTKRDSESSERRAGKDSSASDAEETKREDDLAKHETWQINRLRKIVIQILMSVTLGLCIAIYSVSSSAEHQQYLNQYEGAALLVLDAFDNIMTSRMGVVSSLAIALIAQGEDHSTKKWPFVALSSFEKRAYIARVQSGSMYLHINPVVTEEDRYEWEHEYVIGEDAHWM